MFLYLGGVNRSYRLELTADGGVSAGTDHLHDVRHETWMNETLPELLENLLGLGGAAGHTLAQTFDVQAFPLGNHFVIHAALRQPAVPQIEQ